MKNNLNEVQQKYKELKEILETRDILTWKEGELWNYIKTQGRYKLVFGEGDDTWKSFLAQAGVPLSTVEFKIALYKKFVEELRFTLKELAGTNTRKLHRAIPHIKSHDDAERIISLANELSFSDFLLELTGREPCEHSLVEKSVKVCEKCGAKS